MRVASLNLLVLVISVDQVAYYEHTCLEEVLCVPKGFLWHSHNDELLNHECTTQTIKDGGWGTIHEGEAEEAKVCIENFTELIHDAADQIWLDRPTHAYPIHLLSSPVKNRKLFLTMGLWTSIKTKMVNMALKIPS